MAGLGVSPSGALDMASLRAANRLVGNPAGAAGIEGLENLEFWTLCGPRSGRSILDLLLIRYLCICI
jgi:hypothetical protein